MERKQFLDIKNIIKRKAPSKAKYIPDFVINYLIRKVHQDELNDILTLYEDKQGVDFMEAVTLYFDLHLDICHKERLPIAENKSIFVANHPLGGLDGICLAAFLGKHYNGNIKYIVNDLLMYIPNLKSIFIPVNKHGSQSKKDASVTLNAFDSANQILTFPAGLCSRKHDGIIKDLEWKKSFIIKAVAHQRDVVPIYFSGKNSDFFYRLANFRKWARVKFNLEMLYLPDEMFKNKHKTFQIHIGNPIPWQTFDNSKKPIEWADTVKKIVYELNAKDN